MAVFPVLQSTLSPRHLAKWLEAQYLLTEVSCRVARTNMNHTYLIQSADKKAVLRIYAHAHRPLLEIQEELRILDLLKQAGISVSYPLADRRNVFIQALTAPEGLRYAILFSHAAGAKLRFISADISRQIGRLMASFHYLTRGERVQRIKYTKHVLIHEAILHIAGIFPECMAALNAFEADFLEMEQLFAESEGMRQGIVHLDIWYDNMNIADNGNITLFDFDNLGNGPLVLDIGYFCMQLFYIETDKTVFEEKKTAFLKGYRSIYSVTDEELRFIPYAGLAIWIYYLGLQAERFNLSGNLFLSANYIRMYLSRAKEWMTYCKAN